MLYYGQLVLYNCVVNLLLDHLVIEVEIAVECLDGLINKLDLLICEHLKFLVETLKVERNQLHLLYTGGGVDLLFYGFLLSLDFLNLLVALLQSFEHTLEHLFYFWCLNVP